MLSTIISFILFLNMLPSWSKIRWLRKIDNIDFRLLKNYNSNPVGNFLRGFIEALFLIIIILLISTSFSWLEWDLRLNFSSILNAIFLCFLVGFAEETIFRYWLTTEINLLTASKRGDLLQAIIFSFVHIRWSTNWLEIISLSVGLFIFGFLLAQRRRLDQGSLWGCIGLHGGLVGIWFLVQNCLIKFSENIPFWLIGPGELSPNPLGGLLGILLLLGLLICQRLRDVNSRRRSFVGSISAFSKGAKP